MSQQDLAESVASDANTLRAMLLLLEKKMLIRHDPHPNDRGARLVCLTPEGEQIQKDLWDRSKQYRQGLTDLLGSEDT